MLYHKFGTKMIFIYDRRTIDMGLPLQLNKSNI